jgi:hypothetical protein
VRAIRLSSLRFAPAVLAGFLMCEPTGAFALTITNASNFRDNGQVNSVGIVAGDIQVVSANVAPGGPPTTVSATQSATVLGLGLSGSDLYITTRAWDGTLFGQWAINATRGPDSAGPVLTPGIANPQLLPFVANVHAMGSGLQPVVTWDLPNLTGFDPDDIRVRVYDDSSKALVFTSNPVSTSATLFTVPPGVLLFGHSYIFRVMLEDLEGGNLENRSSGFSQIAFSPAAVPEPSTMLLIASGLIALTRAARRSLRMKNRK